MKTVPKNGSGLGDPTKSGLSGFPSRTGTLAVRHRLLVGQNPSFNLHPDNPGRWAAIDFLYETGRGGGNRIHSRAMCLVGIDPPELFFRGLGPNQTAPYGPNQDGTELEGANLGRGLGRVGFQGLTQTQSNGTQGSFQGWAAHIGCHAGEDIRHDSLTVSLLSETTFGPATPGTIEVDGDLDAITANDGTTRSFLAAGEARIGGTRFTYAGRSSTKLFGCVGGGTKTAELFPDPAGDNNKLRITAKSSGADGNDTTLAYVDPGAPSAALSVDVVGTAITVNLGTDASGNLISTATEVQVAIRASAAAAALVDVNNKFIDSDGSGVVTAMAATNLTGGADSSTFPAGQNIQQVQISNGGVLRFHTSALRTNSRSHRIVLSPEGSVTIGEKAILEGATNFFTVQGGQAHFKQVAAPASLTAEVVGTAGTTTITYKVVGNTPHGGQTSAASVTITDAPDQLDDDNYVRLDWVAGPGCISWDVIRESTDGLPADTGPVVYQQRYEWSDVRGGMAVDRGQAPAGINTVETVIVRNTDSGTFRLGFAGGTTNPINWDTSAADMQSKLEALGSIGAGNVAVTKVQNDPPSWEITFQGTLAGVAQEKLSLRLPHELVNSGDADADDPQDIPLPSVNIRVRVAGGPVAYVLPTYNSTANVKIDGALDHDGSAVGFYGTTPVAKQTGVAVSAAGVHGALVNLGLIAT